MKPFSPILAATVKDRSKLLFPLFCTPKFDGIRAVIKNSRFMSRRLKYIPNEHIQQSLFVTNHSMAFEGFDGELILPDKSFHEIQSATMSREGAPCFSFQVFDYFMSDNVNQTYLKRLDVLKDRYEWAFPYWMKLVLPERVDNLEELEKYERRQIEAGYEGVCMRAGNARYKFGRSTFNEHFLLKLKTFEDAEATIIDYVPLERNGNDSKIDATGASVRSSHKAGMVAQETLGALILKGKDGIEFRCGSGFTELQRYNLWQQRDSLPGKTVTYKYQPHGTDIRPRSPIFKGIRYD